MRVKGTCDIYFRTKEEFGRGLNFEKQKFWAMLVDNRYLFNAAHRDLEEVVDFEIVGAKREKVSMKWSEAIAGDRGAGMKLAFSAFGFRHPGGPDWRILRWIIYRQESAGGGSLLFSGLANYLGDMIMSEGDELQIEPGVNGLAILT